MVRYTTTYRSGPDRLPADTFAGSKEPILWAAYWYREHISCAATSRCRCWTDRSDLGTLAGDGVVIVAYANGFFGVYPLDHRLGWSPLDWTLISESHPHLTWGQCDQLRGAPFEFAGQHGPTKAHSDAQGVWLAVDVAIADVNSSRLG